MAAYYHQQYQGHAAPEQVVIQSNAKQNPVVIHQVTPRWSWCSTGCSVFSMICCSPFFLCGLLGLVFSLTSYTDHKAKDFDRSRSKKNCSIGCSVTAIVLGLVFILGLCLLIYLTPGVLWFTGWYQNLVPL